MFLNSDWFMEIRDITLHQLSHAHFKPVRKARKKSEIHKTVVTLAEDCVLIYEPITENRVSHHHSGSNEQGQLSKIY